MYASSQPSRSTWVSGASIVSSAVDSNIAPGTIAAAARKSSAVLNDTMPLNER